MWKHTISLAYGLLCALHICLHFSRLSPPASILVGSEEYRGLATVSSHNVRRGLSYANSNSLFTWESKLYWIRVYWTPQIYLGLMDEICSDLGFDFAIFSLLSYIFSLFIGKLCRFATLRSPTLVLTKWFNMLLILNSSRSLIFFLL